MASDRDYHLGRIRAAKADASMSDADREKVIAFHNRQLERFPATAAKKGAGPAPAQKPPRAAKKAAATPPAGVQRAASPPAEKIRARTWADHGESSAQGHPRSLLYSPEGPRSKPASAAQSRPAYNPEQLHALASYHEQEHRRFTARGDTRGAAVHAQKASAARQALEEHRQQGGAQAPAAANPTGRPARVANPEAEKHRVDAKRHTALAAEARKNAAASNVEVAMHLDKAAKATDETEAAAHRAQAATHRSHAARFRAEASTHQANAAESYAKAAEASNSDDEKAEHVAAAARHRAGAAKYQAQASTQRAQTAAHQAQKPAEEKPPGSGQRQGRDPLKERRERIEQAAKNFRELLHTGSHELIRHMQREVGH